VSALLFQDYIRQIQDVASIRRCCAMAARTEFSLALPEFTGILKLVMNKRRPTARAAAIRLETIRRLQARIYIACVAGLGLLSLLLLIRP
jgi:hypothetical protein